MDSNTLQTSTTNLSEKKENPSSYLLRKTSDGVLFPYLCASVYVSGPPEDTGGFSSWLGRAGCTRADVPETADFVIFSGGPDVNPEMYGDKTLPKTYIDKDRDEEDNALYEVCVREGIPMVGICRGAQFLWVKLGGKLFQDIDNHNDGSHDIRYFPTSMSYRASSVHHQSVVPRSFDGFRLLASANISTRREAADHISLGSSTDFEIWTVEKKGIVGIQGHPEYPGFPNYSKLCLDVIKNHIIDSSHNQYTGDVLRLN